MDIGHVLCIWYESTSTLLKCAVMETTFNFDTIIGIAKDNGLVAGQTCNVFLTGIANNFSGLNVGNIYYFKSDGTFTDNIHDPLLTEPLRILGKALTSTTMQLYEQNYYGY